MKAGPQVLAQGALPSSSLWGLSVARLNGPALPDRKKECYQIVHDPLSTRRPGKTWPIRRPEGEPSRPDGSLIVNDTCSFRAENGAQAVARESTVGIRPFLALGLALGALVTACETPAIGTASSPVIIREADQGTTVTVRRGQHLVLSLAAPSPRHAAEAWTLAFYPKQALRLLVRSSPPGRFEFEAVAVGSGKIVALTHLRGSRCGPPAAASPQCLQSRQPENDFPPRPDSFVVLIRVVP